MATPAFNEIPTLSPEQEKTLVAPDQPWTDDRAYAIAYGDFVKAEQYRYQNHDRRFKVSDELYLGWVNKKSWEGTRIPRASISIFMALEQIEALMPSVIGALFANDPPFDVSPLPSSTLEQAYAVRTLLNHQLQSLGEEENFMSAREIMRQVFKQSLIYGNGLIEFSWMIRQIQKLVYSRRLVPERTLMEHPELGQIPVPTGEMKLVIRKDIENQNLSRPHVQVTDIRDFYIDPNCPTPNVQFARFCATRHLLTITKLKEMTGGDQDFQLPPDEELIKLAQRKPATEGDNDKAQIEAYRGGSWQPSQDYSVDPNLARVEVIRYWQRDRHVWFIRNYKTPIYNQPNQYGMLPFLNAFYVDVPSRFYGLSLCDLVEGDQKLAETIINARIDELNLMIHSPLIRKRGMPIPASMRRLRPGVEWEADDPSKDIVRMEMGNVTAQAFIEVDALERRVQKTTGVTDFSSLGTASAGGNSALRTATGAGIQSAASGRRVQYQVENIEDQFIVPLLNVIHGLNQKFLDPEQAIAVLGPLGEQLQLDPLDVLNASVRFNMMGSAKMRARQALQGGGLQMLLETYMNPAMQGQMLEQRGMVLDIAALDQLVMDTMNLPARTLWRQASQQEVQAASQPSPDQALRAQMQQERLASQQDTNTENNETKLLVALLSKIITPDAAHAALGLPAPAEIVAKHAPAPAPKGK